jgi:hypothetical protein
VEWTYSVQIRVPTGVRDAANWHLYRLPPGLTADTDPDAFEHAVQKVKDIWGCPTGWDWPWDVSVFSGEPEPPVLARVTLTDWSAGVPQ